MAPLLLKSWHLYKEGANELSPMKCKTVTRIAVIIGLIFAAVFAVTVARAADTAVVGDLQIKLIIDPDPLAAGKEATIFVKLLRRPDLEPVTHATVRLSARLNHVSNRRSSLWMLLGLTDSGQP
jgi:hypothetical protein